MTLINNNLLQPAWLRTNNTEWRDRLLITGPGGSSPIPGIGQYNFSRAQFAPWRSALARVKAGTGRGMIAAIGESTTWGLGGGTDTGATGIQDAQPASWPSILANSLSVSGTHENIFGSGSTANLISYQQNFYKRNSDAANAWSFPGNITMGGDIFGNSTDTNTFSYQPEIPVDTFELWTPQNSGYGTLLYNIDGAANTNQVQAGTAALIRTIIPAGSVGTHTLNMRLLSASGTARVIGFRSWNSTVPAVDVINVGWGGSKTSDWDNSSAPYSPLSAMQNLCATADVTTISIQINDEEAGTNLATYSAQTQALITAAVAGGGTVIIVSGNPISIAQVSLATQMTYLNVLKALAISNNLPLIDQYAIYGTWELMAAEGFTFNAVHPNAAGYANFGAYMASTLTQWSV